LRYRRAGTRSSSLTAATLGALVNYGSYSAVVTLLPAGTWVPLLGVAVGALAGLGFNFTASRRFVFKADPAEPTSTAGRAQR
jgi:putative flippase GtrA